MRGSDPPLSRTGLPAEVRAAVEEILEELGQAQRLSQTGLRRRVRRKALQTLGEIPWGAADPGTGGCVVTDRPGSLTG